MPDLQRDTHLHGDERRASAIAHLHSEIVGADHVDPEPDVKEDDTHDESLTARPIRPVAVVRPGCSDEVAAIVRMARKERVQIGRAHV